MALKATIFKASVQISDMDRHYYQDHNITIAQHPSETDDRMMVRLLAFALNASESLTFTKGLSADDEPELWDKSLADEVLTWVEFGEPDEKWLRKASARAKQVVLYTYGGRSVPVWWKKNQANLERYKNLAVYNIPEDAVKAMGLMVNRQMSLSYSISEGEVWLSNGQDSIQIIAEQLK